ncbi:chemotaxis response regulator protein-glutamate methylesterase [Paenibacillus sp. LHD-117]|uniref:protein-glutamate methylesterase/protein-glutamine glutaminase n=1 Tax=Paenibacillus sp. LHD-117 TaxID=3071412 RepID=UPI0027DEBAE2|nr:chemotaxis response regulator protein-glutamate methylesterase [Paenibacillus sp. LHD-117]MDQ6419238.1 chemotaxis response regulator protein-glutamate methylesterase [Paenibacillus sp. LHD-117]
MAPYRVLVVDDSAFMRAIISDLIVQDKRFTIAATASNGMEAIASVREHQPDVITMDLEMPQMNGLEALQFIMKENPRPIIMLSGISEDNTRDTIKALQFGAFDFIRKPSGVGSDDIHAVGEQLLEKLRTAAYVKTIKEAQSSRNSLVQETSEAHAAGQLPETSESAARAHATTRLAPSPPADADLHNPKNDPRIDLNGRNAKPVIRDAGKQHDVLAKAGLVSQTPKLMKSPAEPKPEVKGTKPPAASKPEKKISNPDVGPKANASDLGVGKGVQPSHQQGARPSQVQASGTFRDLVAIGTSTGGPRALHEVICSLPGDFPAPVLVVQHMPPKFTKSLAQRLDSFSQLTVVEAEQGMKVKAGIVYVAPGGYHMELARDDGGYAIRLGEQPQRNGHRPSVDVMFESLAPFRELSRHAVIMTGMGSDGAKGMKLLAEQGAASLIAESEETCIVYGMPRCAVEGGFVQEVLPLGQIASQLVKAVTK